MRAIAYPQEDDKIGGEPPPANSGPTASSSKLTNKRLQPT